MDEYGGTFFDLVSSTPSYPLCSGGAYPNDLGSFTNAETYSKLPGASIQEQVSDLDSLLLPAAEIATNANTMTIESKTSEIHREVNGNNEGMFNLLSNKSIKTEIMQDSFFQNSSVGFMEQSQSLDAILDQCNTSVMTNNATVHSRIATAPVKLEKLPNVPRIIRPDGTVQTLTAGSKIQIQGLSAGSKMIRVCVAKSNTQLNAMKSVPNVQIAPVQCKQEVFDNNPETFTISAENLKPVENMKEDLDNPKHVKVIVSNVVASFRVRCHLSLRRIALEGVDVVYRRESQKVVMRLRNPKCTAYMWSSGKIVCTGSSSEPNAKKAARKIARRLENIGFKIRFSEFKVVNVLAVSKMPYAIDINEFSQAHRGRHCSYEPELHPGVTYRINDLKATLKIFSTGSVTVTARSVQRAEDAVKQVYPSFKPFYKFDRPNHWGDFEDALPSDTEDCS